jgi:prevent-host-death family protein
MTRHVPISEFKDHASELVAAAERGEEIVITRHGKAVAALRSANSTSEDREARARAALASLDDLRAKAAYRGQTATADEWSAWKREGQR